MLRLALVTLCVLAFVVSSAFAASHIAILSGANQVPVPVSTTAIGLGVFSYDTGTKTLVYNLVHNISSPVAAHIHGPATTAQTSALIAVISSNGVSPISGSMVLSDSQETQLLGGLWYINVHSTSQPDGELRGQITAPSNTFACLMSGANEVPPVTTSSTGVAYVTSVSTNVISYSVQHTVSNPTSIRMFASPADNVVHNFGLTTWANGYSVAGVANFSSTDLSAGKYYVNVLSSAFTSGEVRCSLTALATTNTPTTKSAADVAANLSAVLLVVLSLLALLLQ
jgi:hypothetical protein